MENYPVLLAEPHGDVQFKVWCPFCQQYHFHGATEGHREAHCFNKISPFRKTGYIIKLKKSLNVKKIQNIWDNKPKIADGPEDMAWYLSGECYFLVDFRTNQSVAFILKKKSRYRWKLRNNRESGIEYDLITAMSEAEGAIEIPLRDDKRSPNPDYDHEKFPIGPITPKP